MRFDEFFDTHTSVVKNEENRALIELEVPGASREAIKLDYESGRLSVSGKYRGKSLSESFVIPEQQYDAANISASLKDGVLSVVVPKRIGSDRGRRKILIE